MVRLLPWLYFSNIDRAFSFNPTMVRLLLVRGVSIVDLTAGFNPTMVRLLLFNSSSPHCRSVVSIPQWCDCCPALQAVKIVAKEFQSHNGAIAAHFDW